MKRILEIVSESTWRGGENQLHLMMTGLKEKYEFHLAAPENSAILEKLDGAAVPIPLKMSGARVITAAMFLNRYCKERAITLVNTQAGRAHNIGLIMKWLNPSLKLIVHRRVDNKPGSGRISQFKYQTDMVNRYVAISRAIGNVLTDYGVSPDKINVVHSAVDHRKFMGQDKKACRTKLCQELGWDVDIPIIANVGYLTEQKGQMTLINALGRLAKEGIGFQCFIAGDGHLRDELQRGIEKYHMEKQVILLGVRNDVPDLLAAADILSMPSNNEGLGTTILDGIHSGLAVVASEVGGIPEIVSDGENGMLHPVGDSAAHARHLQAYIKSPELRSQHNLKARAKADQEFSIDSMVQGNQKIFEDFLSC